MHTNAYLAFFNILVVALGLSAGPVSRASEASQWQQLIQVTRGDSVRETLALANQHTNRISHLSDRKNWQVDDYWATPFELLARGAGDCEDLAIAKYYLLRAHGLQASQLRFMFSRVYNSDNGTIEPHLVLLFYAPGSRDPLVLDNTRQDILPLSYRKDLLPTAAFDLDTYWVFSNNNWHVSGKATDVRPWQPLQRRWAKQTNRTRLAALGTNPL